MAIALGVVLRDSKSRRREAADALTSWLITEPSAAEEVTRLEVHAVNSGSHLITRLRVVWHPKTQQVATPLIGSSLELADWEVVRPGAQVSLPAPKGTTEDSVSGRGFIQFTDYRNRTWFRELGTDRYISRRTAERRWKGRLR